MVGSLDIARLPLGTAQREVIRATRSAFAPQALFARQLLAVRLQSVPVPLPQLTTVVYLALWESEDALALFRETSLTRWTQGGEHLRLTLAPIQSFGSWRGADPLGAARTDPVPGCPALLITHSRTRARSTPSFLVADRPVVRSLAAAPGHLWAGGFTDRLRSLDTGTLSLWRSMDDALAFAYRSDRHRVAVKTQKERGWFEESWFARFSVVGADGHWRGLRGAALKPERENLASQ